MKTKAFTPFLLGIAFGSVGALTYFNLTQSLPSVTLDGKAQLDTASYQDPRLQNAIFISNPTPSSESLYRHPSIGSLYLQFNDRETMNEAIGKRVRVTGQLKFTKLDSGGAIAELTVDRLQHLD